MLTIDSKEDGQILLTEKNMLGTQLYFIDQVAQGIEEGIHFFVALKGRQEGITSVCGALDLFWHYENSGMQGTFASHNEEARDNFRAMLTMYHSGLPRSHRMTVMANNRHFISFKNRAVIKMQIGGSAKSSGKKGRGTSSIFMHGTEISSWEDQESLSSMLASLSQSNPKRLYIFESTARGFELFQEMWANAKEATTQRAIFIGWWLNDKYRKSQDSPEYKVYWNDKLSPAEMQWVQAVKQYYGYDIDSEQMAWWRWMQAEMINDENMMLQEFPPTEYHAFILSGDNFFSLSQIEQIEKLTSIEEPPKCFRFSFGNDFTETECVETSERLADMKVWEEPDPDGFYCVSGDPAYGSSDWADRFVIQVFRCYADRFEQAAEFCVTDMSPFKFAWVVCYLAGAYKSFMVNIEINGPGEAVLAEMNSLRNKASSLPRLEAKRLTDVLGHMQYYIYRRLDSPGGGGGAYHFKTTQGSKERIMNIFLGMFNAGTMKVHSLGLLDEMKKFVRKPDEGYLGASGKHKDDRVIAAALAAEIYHRYIQTKLQQMKVTWGQEMEKRAKLEETGVLETAVQSAMGRNIRNFLQRSGIKQE